MQSQRENVERHRTGSSLPLRREEEYRVGRLKHDRVRIPRGENILAWGRQLMRAHIDRQTVLEVEFMGEEGTGLGPTLEFYSLIAAEFQRKDLCKYYTYISNLNNYLKVTSNILFSNFVMS